MYGKILIAEDDPDILRILVHTLTRAGYDVVPAYGGADAIRKVKRDRFDLVLTDLAMPGTSGVNVIASIKGDPDTQHIPTVAVTAFPVEKIRDRAMEAGCDGVIPKPFRREDLLREVGKFLKKPAGG